MTEAGRVVVAMSGGVDSSTAAALLQDRGLEVIGATLRTQDGPGIEASLQAARDAAANLGIDHRVLDCRSAFTRRVLRPCWEAYSAGRTPNPCGLCNPGIKFDSLLRLADELDAAWVATGHHARVDAGAAGPVLLRGADPDKDQSYFLFGLGPEALARVQFPVGQMTKARVRELARRAGLPCADAPESQDACIALEAGGFSETLRLRFEAAPRPGPFVDETGRELGRHQGIHRYTIGQRRGLGLALGRPAWVAAIEPEADRIVVTTDSDRLLAQGLEAAQTRFGARFTGLERGECQVQIRSRHRACPATFTRKADCRFEVRFQTPQRAVSPGQAAVLYSSEQVLGGGWITRALH